MKNVLIVFGGKSKEHEVSVSSAQSIEDNIDSSRFKTSAMGITHQGTWHYGPTINQVTQNGKVIPAPNPSLIPSEKILSADMVFLILHGPNGEDGNVQGLLELLNMPYVGSGVLGSALAMDKIVQKQLCAYHQIPQTKYVGFSHHDWANGAPIILKHIEQELSYPLFIKPANMGSSVVVSKVKTQYKLKTAIQDALQYDLKLIAEEGVTDIKEIEVSVLGNEEPQASVCGEIRPNTEFYDYETKYVTDDIETAIPAKIPQKISKKIQTTAVKAFQVLNCAGLARVDFFYQPQTRKYFLNEINTLPGFTSISMYPKLWAATGVSYTKLITRLLELAEDRWQKKQKLVFEYQP